MGIYNITTVPESGTYTATQLAKGITFSISHDIPSNVSRSLSVYVKSTNGVTIVCKDNADSEDVYYDGIYGLNWSSYIPSQFTIRSDSGMTLNDDTTIIISFVGVIGGDIYNFSGNECHYEITGSHNYSLNFGSSVSSYSAYEFHSGIQLPVSHNISSSAVTYDLNVSAFCDNGSIVLYQDTYETDSWLYASDAILWYKYIPSYFKLRSSTGSVFTEFAKVSVRIDGVIHGSKDVYIVKEKEYSIYVDADGGSSGGGSGGSGGDDSGSDTSPQYYVNVDDPILRAYISFDELYNGLEHSIYYNIPDNMNCNVIFDIYVESGETLLYKDDRDITEYIAVPDGGINLGYGSHVSGRHSIPSTIWVKSQNLLSKKTRFYIWPEVALADSSLECSSISFDINVVSAVESNSPPTTILINGKSEPYISVFEQTCTLSWSGAISGLNNEILGYLIEYIDVADSEDDNEVNAAIRKTYCIIDTSETFGSCVVPCQKLPEEDDTILISRRYYITTIGYTSDLDSGPSSAASAWVRRIKSTACLAPSIISLDSTLSLDDVVMSWRGASYGYGEDGSENTIVSYRIQRAESEDGITFGDWVDVKIIDTLNTDIPDFTYNGDYEASAHGVYKWLITLKSSGTISFTNNEIIDLFIVGAGGGGGYYGGGGGSGYVATHLEENVTAGESYDINIGNGGSGGTSGSHDGSSGEQTNAFGFTALGGNGGLGYDNAQGPNGGDGGSGGGAAGRKQCGDGGSDGSDGGNGISDVYDSATSSFYYDVITATGGRGNGDTTRAFGEDNGKLYAAGGGAGVAETGVNPGLGGAGGGGYIRGDKDGAINTGSGGAGGIIISASTSINAGSGGSGVVLIRNSKGFSTLVSPPSISGNYYKFRIRAMSLAGGHTNSEWVECPDLLRRDHDPIPPFTDDLIAGVTYIKALHMTEMQYAIAILREFNKLPNYYFTTIVSEKTKLADWTKHITELRTAIDEMGVSHDDWITIEVNYPTAAVVEQLRTIILSI